MEQERRQLKDGEQPELSGDEQRATEPLPETDAADAQRSGTSLRVGKTVIHGFHVSEDTRTCVPALILILTKKYVGYQR